MSGAPMTMGRFLGRAARIVAGKRGFGFLLLAALVVQVGFNLALPVTYRFVIDGAIAGGDVPLLARLLLVLAGLYLLNGAAGLAQDRSAARIGADTAAALRDRLFRQVQAQGPGFFARVQEGEVIACFTSDVSAVETALVRAVPGLAIRIATIMLSTALLFVIEWRLALVAFGMMPLLFLAPRLFSPGMRETGRRRDGEQARLVAFLQESILAHPVVRTLGLQGERTRRMEDQLSGLRLLSFRSHHLASLAGRAAVLAAWLLQIVVLGAGAWLAIDGHMTAGLLIAFIGLLLNIGGATDQLTQVIPLLMDGAGGLSRIDAMLAHAPDLADAPDATELEPLARGLSLRDVEFAYAPGNPILHGLSLTIPAGKAVAIVGGSGSGKSTVLSLLVRLYDPVRGSVSYDGTDLRAARLDSLSRQTSIVLQDTPLFDTSIRENIRLGRPDATDAEVEAAARAANLHDTALGLPDGYDTRVGFQGGRLSGGQRQRVAVARALLRRSSVLLLDEATSAMDAVNEAAINRTLTDAWRGRTLVSATHRLGNVTDYDLIVVMEGGRIAETGTHGELVGRGGPYAALWAKQSGFSIRDGTASITPERLMGIPFLSGCGRDALEWLCEVLVSETFPAGRNVFVEGDDGNRFYIVARGRLENYVLWSEGCEHVLSIMDDGDWFGELALIEPVPRTWSVRTITDTVCLTLDRKHFHALMTDHPKLKDMVKTIARLRMDELARAIEGSIGP